MNPRYLICSMVITSLAAWGQQATTLQDQTDVALTAYNNGLALVRDVRKLTLGTGTVALRFEDVAEQIRPETVSLQSVSGAGSVRILEQNYEYDLISPEKLMEKYVGQTVSLINFSKEVGFERVEAELMSINGGPVYRVDGQIYLGHPGSVVLPKVPENLIAKPSLIWTLENDTAGQTLEATYLTNGVSWKADYVVTLAKDEKKLDIDGWVTMNNQSGATFTNARLKLVAGDVNQVQPQVYDKMARNLRTAEMAVAAPMPSEESFAEYHLYSMPRRTTIKQNQSKQLALLTAASVGCRKVYEYRGQTYFYYQPMQPMLGEHVEVFLDFKNEEKNDMGMPLPAGIMRVYQEDSEAMLQFAGEDQIKHTPKDEMVKLRLGKAFDVIGDRVQTDFRQIASDVFESAYEITVRNHKEQDITVDVVEPMQSDWEIIQKSQDFEKKDAFTAIFHVAVKADGEAKVTYRVRVKT